MARSFSSALEGVTDSGAASRNAKRWLAAAPRVTGFAATLGLLAIAGGSTGAANQTYKLDDRLRAIALKARGDFSQSTLQAVFRGMDPAALSLAERFSDPAGADARLSLVGYSGASPLTSPDAAVSAEALQTLSWDAARVVNASVPFSAASNPAAAPFTLPAAEDDRAKAVNCLAQAVYYEAAFETPAGQAAVAQVVLNRVRHPLYPKTVCGVVYQGSELSTGCQFTFTCDGSLARQPTEWAWKQAVAVAARALAGYVEPTVGYATNYHADYVVPYWAPSLSKVAKLGAHIFYRWPGGMGSPAAFNGRYVGGEAAGGKWAAQAALAAAAAAAAETAAEPQIGELVAASPAEHLVQEPVVVAALDVSRAGPTQLAPPSAPKLAVEAPRSGPRIAVPNGW